MLPQGVIGTMMLKSVGHAEPALSLTGPGIADPSFCCTLQQESCPHTPSHSGEIVLPLTAGMGELVPMAWA